MRAISRGSRLALALTLVIVGCAHSRAQNPASQPTSTGSEPGSASGTEPGTTPANGTASAPASPDPSEQSTAEELATIPDPVPGTPEAPLAPPSGVAPSGTAPTGSTPGATGTVSGDASNAIWRVQVFASPDRAQAERTAQEASSRLGESYVLDHEDSLYKVRLGAFTTESAAEPLKRRAVLEGYTGAFRVRIATK